MRDPASSIAPDFRAGPFVVRQRVVRIGELVEDPTLAFVAHALSNVAGEFHAALFRRQNQFGAIGTHRLTALDALVLRHDEDHAVATHRGGHGERNAGIAGGGLDQRVARLDVATRLGARHHRQRRTILHRTGRVVAFELGEDDVATCRDGGAGQSLQANQRRVADEVLQRLIHYSPAIRRTDEHPPPPSRIRPGSRQRAAS